MSKARRTGGRDKPLSPEDVALLDRLAELLKRSTRADPIGDLFDAIKTEEREKERPQ